MSSPYKHPLPEEYEHLYFLFDEVRSLSPHLDFETYKDKVYVFAIPDKGDPNEEDSLDSMDDVMPLIRSFGLLPEPLYRGTPKGDRIDGVRVLLPAIPPKMKIEAFIRTPQTVH